jgi:hypothetical protein
MGKKRKLSAISLISRNITKKRVPVKNMNAFAEKMGLFRKFPSRMNRYSTLRVDEEGGGIMLSPNRYASLGVIDIQTCGL